MHTIKEASLQFCPLYLLRFDIAGVRHETHLLLLTVPRLCSLVLFLHLHRGDDVLHLTRPVKNIKAALQLATYDLKVQIAIAPS